MPKLLNEPAKNCNKIQLISSITAHESRFIITSWWENRKGRRRKE